MGGAHMGGGLAGLPRRGREANTNFNISNYEQELAHFNEVCNGNGLRALAQL